MNIFDKIHNMFKPKKKESRKDKVKVETKKEDSDFSNREYQIMRNKQYLKETGRPYHGVNGFGLSQDLDGNDNLVKAAKHYSQFIDPRCRGND